jgi:putative oxidoreductase
MNDDVGKLILRLALGILVLFHGIAKLKGGIGFLAPMVTGMGLPAWFSYGVYLGEVLGPIMVILGLFTRIGAFFIFVNMLFAIFLVHMPELMTLGKQGGWALELQGMFLFTALAIMLMSPGRYAVTRRF